MQACKERQAFLPDRETGEVLVPTAFSESSAKWTCYDSSARTRVNVRYLKFENCHGVFSPISALPSRVGPTVASANARDPRRRLAFDGKRAHA